MIKRLSPRHREAIRRLAVGEAPQEIAEGVGISRQTLGDWMRDPQFQSELVDLQYRMQERIINDPDRLEAIEVLKSAAHDAALLCKTTLKDENADLNIRMKTAWDILDRTEGKPMQRQVTTSLNLTDLILAAHKEMKEEDSGAESTTSS